MNDIHQITDLGGTTHDIKDYRIPALPSDGKKFWNGNGAWANLVDVIYPVGSIYMSASSTDPGTLFGGTWEALENRFLVGAGDDYTAGDEGGEALHTLTESELPVVEKGMNFRNFYNSSNGNIESPMAQTGTDGTVNSQYSLTYNAATIASVHSNNTATHFTMSFGSGTAHNNIPPYLAVYMWQRTA